MLCWSTHPPQPLWPFNSPCKPISFFLLYITVFYFLFVSSIASKIVREESDCYSFISATSFHLLLLALPPVYQCHCCHCFPSMFLSQSDGWHLLLVAVGGNLADVVYTNINSSTRLAANLCSPLSVSSLGGLEVSGSSSLSTRNKQKTDRWYYLYSCYEVKTLNC